ncbi:TonB-dependent receptor [Limnovirga soli]|uniref:TonB-dependent receptor plug domain-containing protein n=1 Tax=Limnovirga soli TaxID=2656915 RepID=A0A8J8JVE7_9BACT|nr:carboxypeptidase regulatory-like domain-containing protein [Limnovirga soli]NNV56554.1 TonB-dependent receptor plug domain-containing protein [Limnovirga soli]
MRKSVNKILGIFLFLGLAIASFAQETTSDIIGVVTDNGNAIGGATITALHVPTGTKYVTTSRKDGRYNLPNLKIGGPYTITVSYVGFKAEPQENVSLLLGQEYKADFALVADSKSLTEVVVSAVSQNKIFNNSRTGSQEIISRSQIERLPTINRSLQDFTKLTPSANGLSFGGRNGAYNNITVDGANFNNAFGLSGTLGGQTNSQPISLDAIEQIQVNISPFDVRQGGFSGAGVNSVTRSGTNQVKGTVYTYLKGPGTQGYNVRTAEIPKQQFDYSLNGFAFGGALVKNKLFYFVSAEQERVTTPATSYIASDANNQPNPASVSLANADTLNKLKQFLIDTYGYNPGEYQGYSYKTKSDKLTAKIDWNINTKNTFTIKYNYLKSSREIAASNSGAPGGNRQPGATSLPFSGSGYVINNNFNILIAELNTRFNNRMSNKLQVGITQLRDFRASLAGADFPLVDIMNGQGQTYTSFGYEPFTYNNVLNTDIIQFSDIFTMYKGSHELTFGTQNYIKKFKNGFAPNYQGVYRFNTLTDFYNSAINGAANATSYNLQYAVTKDGSFPFAKIGSTELGFFAQDKWRVNNKFTLTYGLRVDLPIFKDQFESNPYVPALTFRDGKKYDVGLKPGTNPLFSPRVGFNWDVTGDKKTQVRGGVGIFAGPPPFVWISNQASNNGVQFGSFSKTNVAFSEDVNTYRPSATAENTSYNLVFTDKDFKYPQALKASLAIDRKLPGNVVATLEATYSKDIDAVYFQNVNLPSTGKAFVGSDPRIRYDSTKIWGGKPTASVTNPNISNAILMTNANEGYAYNITFQLQKTMRNFYASIAYTYSNSKSLNDGGSIAASMWRDRPVQGDPNAIELGYANFYQPHRVIASASYRFEYGKHYATSIGLIFEAAPAGVGSFTYNGDANNDGTGGNNDLIYIPKDATDIVLVPVNTGGGTITDTRTPAQIYAQLNNFIKQDPYLSAHRGEVAARNAAVLPFYKRLDLNITQDIYFFTGKEKNKHTLRLTFDLINAGNFVNKNWGIAKQFTSTSFLKYEGLVPSADPNNAGKPRFSFPYVDPSNQIPLVNSYTDNTSIFSRWQGQFGIRYIFN